MVQLVELIVNVEDPSITPAVNLTEPNAFPPVTAGLEPAAPANSNPANSAGTPTTATNRVRSLNLASSGLVVGNRIRWDPDGATDQLSQPLAVVPVFQILMVPLTMPALL